MKRKYGGTIWAICALLFALVVALSILLVPRTEDIDSGSYRLMAAGEPARRPYANRILHPLLVRTLFSLGGPHQGGPHQGGPHSSAANTRDISESVIPPPAYGGLPLSQGESRNCVNTNSQFSILNSQFSPTPNPRHHLIKQKISGVQTDGFSANDKKGARTPRMGLR